MEYKKIITNTLTLSSANLALRGLNFLILPLYAKILTPSDYGVLDLFNVYVSFGIVLFSLEINQGFSRYYAEGENENIKNNLFVSSFFGLLILLAFSLAILFPFLNLFHKSIFETDNKNLIYLYTVNVFLSALFNLFVCKLNWELKVKQVAIFTILNGLLSLLGSLIFVLNGYKYMGVILANCLSLMTLNLVLIFSNKKVIAKHTYSHTLFIRVVKFSYPLVLSSVSSYFFLYADRFMIKEILDIEKVGIFGIAYRLSSIVPLFATALSSALIPMVIMNHKSIQTKIKLTKLKKIYFSLGSLACLFLAGIAKPLILFISRPMYVPAAYLLVFICAGLFISNFSIFYPGVVIQEKTKLLARINILNASVSLILSFLFIKYVGLIGAGFGCLISSISSLVINRIYSNQCYKDFILTRHLVSALLVMVLLLFISHQFDFNMGFCFISLFIYAAFLYQIKWLNWRDLKSILRLR